jgi:pimeloyl-ACP methyl ester carboxylesterase
VGPDVNRGNLASLEIDRVLDVYGVAAAHVVGVSGGGAFAQLLAVGFPERVLSL